jgi:hypothetical protein
MHDPMQRAFYGTDAIVSLRAFAADPSGLSFIADIRAENVDPDVVICAFDEHASASVEACSIRAVQGLTAAPRTTDECHLQSGGGGIGDDRLGCWTFRLRVPLTDTAAVRMFVGWDRMASAEASFDVGGRAIAEAAMRSRTLSGTTG